MLQGAQCICKQRIEMIEWLSGALMLAARPLPSTLCNLLTDASV